VVVVAALKRHGVPFDVLVDGDNALVFLRHGDSSRVLGTFAQDVLQSSGHEVTLERPVRVIEEIRFGQSAPVYLGSRGWTMVRDYRKVLSGALSSHVWLREPRFAREWLRGVAGCELSLARGVPVLQAWALELQALVGSPQGVRAFPHRDYLALGAWFAGSESALPICPLTRVSFERAFGLEPEAQVALEKRVCARLRVGLEMPYRRVDHVTFDRWEYTLGFPRSV
jgi:hypothetical protein